LNVIVWDFFLLELQVSILSPFIVKTVAGEFRREVVVLLFDAVIGNPPYTR